jgi:peptidoglycan/LPS O-acetylase OafA/YrhL
MANSTLEQKNSSRIPSLDGIRAIAIASVLGLHLSQRYGWPQTGTLTHRLLVAHSLTFWPDGVGIFFALSGFLITTLLLKEYDSRGSISLKDFYVRRCFRILPPLYTYLLFVIGFCLFEHIHIDWKAFAGAAFFYLNYNFHHGFWAIDHVWSLSVEEQFYFLWPALLIWGLRHGGRKGATRIAIACIALAPVFRVGGKLAHIRMFEHHVGQMFQNRMDALMCGCLIAVLVGNPGFERFYRKISPFGWFFVAYTFVISHLLAMIGGIDFLYSIGLTLEAISTAVMILWLARNPDSLLGRFLNLKIVAYVGVLSYSAYLWQTFFIHSSNPTALGRMPYAFLWIWVMAWLSYTVIEQPALRLRNRVYRNRRVPSPQIL